MPSSRQQWLRRHPFAVDAVLALAVFALAVLVPDPDNRAADGGGMFAVPTAAVFVAGITCSLLIVRRARPMLVLVLTTVGTVLAMLASDGPTFLSSAAWVAIYTVALHSNRRMTWAAWAGATTVLFIGAVVTPHGSGFDPDLIGDVAWTCVAAAVGDAIRSRRAFVTAIEERAAKAEQGREQEARRQVAEERLRIARDLHDVVAHHIAVVNVQAGVASYLLPTQPEAAQEALGHVRDAAGTILSELSDILEVLRSPEDETPTAPTPGLDQLDELIASFGSAGLMVDWSLSGPSRPAAPVVELVAYRFAQEALTNAQKHGTGSAHLTVTYAADTLRIAVTNPVRESGAALREGSTGGHGMLGMRERASAVGGTLTASPPEHGQFRVEAVLPLAPAL